MSQNQVAHLKYRPDIDGLRAVAVLSVFFFHLNHQWLPGGFVGVDIFFVISGYLITSVLYNDCKTGRFNLNRFYQRRVARIFPALFTVALATLVGAAYIYTPQDFASTGAALVAATLSLANVKFMMQGDYFHISQDAQPFLHYWSLSVEEQFYLIFPLFLFLIFRYARRYLVPILLLLGIGSLFTCVILTQIKPIWAFYLLPTRAWELCAGCLLAVTPLTTINGRFVRIPHWLPALGLLLIGCSFVLLHEGPQFPGWQAVLPVVGTVAIIWPRETLHGPVARFLSARPMVNIGKLSYSLYLWHWPVFSLIDYRLYLMLDEMRLVLKISLSLLLTILTYHFIENPARTFLNRPQSRRVAYVALGAVLVLCVPLGLSVRQNNFVDAEISDVAKGGLEFPGNIGAATVVLMGDSNGSMYGKEIKRICSELGYKLNVISVSAGDSLPERKTDSSQLWRDSLDAVSKIKPDYLLVANSWSGKLRNDPKRLVVALDKLKPYAGQIILLNQPPILPKIANRKSIREGARPPFLENTDVRAERLKVNEFLINMQTSGVSVVDISRHFEGKNGEVLFLDEHGRILYHDPGHLSGYGAEKVHDVLKQALRERPAGSDPRNDLKLFGKVPI
ncbi:acyltransferase 3 [Desulfuromonas soudanensis]|uniref:Acyltransferase 3 n=1 Tax=Desulfuromonas soudanensis TaxID=1603606 RepID=A0A0M4D277_9BACT|nr:acyltransferase family protein [Desulfuromonas soudanensis]ALC17034.1 acyltransferase 3 [Desulfuromonas soudanensis]